MSKRKDYQELTTYDIYFVDIKTIMNSKGISQNILSKISLKCLTKKKTSHIMQYCRRKLLIL